MTQDAYKNNGSDTCADNNYNDHKKSNLHNTGTYAIKYHLSYVATTL